ncbi:hypothetical protein EVAR_39499_1 [Eumeta japonica]|uniref:Uncharacterized protein n=1 Tax=Eumeta variegata TaxID=151549 RepID=A0A4C1W1X7_EUMVA|nr:hypothetical protein EVAR_39499_1 [Eumeta japonica]
MAVLPSRAGGLLLPDGYGRSCVFSDILKLSGLHYDVADITARRDAFTKFTRDAVSGRGSAQTHEPALRPSARTAPGVGGGSRRGHCRRADGHRVRSKTTAVSRVAYECMTGSTFKIYDIGTSECTAHLSRPGPERRPPAAAAAAPGPRRCPRCGHYHIFEKPSRRRTKSALHKFVIFIRAPEASLSVRLPLLRREDRARDNSLLSRVCPVCLSRARPPSTSDLLLLRHRRRRANVHFKARRRAVHVTAGAHSSFPRRLALEVAQESFRSSGQTLSWPCKARRRGRAVRGSTPGRCDVTRMRRTIDKFDRSTQYRFRTLIRKRTPCEARHRRSYRARIVPRGGAPNNFLIKYYVWRELNRYPSKARGAGAERRRGDTYPGGRREGFVPYLWRPRRGDFEFVAAASSAAPSRASADALFAEPSRAAPDGSLERERQRARRSAR